MNIWMIHHVSDTLKPLSACPSRGRWYATHWSSVDGITSGSPGVDELQPFLSRNSAPHPRAKYGESDWVQEHRGSMTSSHLRLPRMAGEERRNGNTSVRMVGRVA